MKEKIDIKYHSNGKKMHEIPRLYGLSHGFSKWWNKDGSLSGQEPCKNGLRTMDLFP